MSTEPNPSMEPAPEEHVRATPLPRPAEPPLADGIPPDPNAITTTPTSRGEVNEQITATPPPPADLGPETAEEREDRQAREWLEKVYQGDRVRQLSVRSIVTGMLIGAVMSISNLYVGLKTGWGLGVTITACIIAYAVFKALEQAFARFRNDPFTILENNTMSSAASAAGYMASAGLVSAIPALYMTTGRNLAWWEMMSWLAAVSVLGVFMAVPLKRQLINIDQLPFPSGIATAETLRSMHSHGAEALEKAKSLFWAGGIGAAVAFYRDGLMALTGWLAGKLNTPGIPKAIAPYIFPDTFPLYPNFSGVDAQGSPAGPEYWNGPLIEKKYTLGFEGSLIMVAAGAIMGIRVGVSLLVGAIFFYGIVAPILIAESATAVELGRRPIIDPAGGYRAIVSWTLWPATAMMVTSGLLSFALRWRTVVRAFSGLMSIFVRRPDDRPDPLADIEVPGSWFVWGTALSGLACVLLGHYLFGVTWWMGVVAVFATFLLSIVAALATGETDVTPIGAMGKITQLVYGVIAPRNMTTNLMTASITAGAASHSADLLTDLKSGYLLGGNPRKQTIAQLFGVLAGTLLCVPIYAIIVTPEKLGSAELPAPAAKVWASVAVMLAEGLDALPPFALAAMFVGGFVGILITLAEELLPKKFRMFIPSATGLGIAGVIPAFNSISMFLGAFIAWLLSKGSPKTDEKYTVPVSSGLIAGESLMGVAIILCMQGPKMVQEIWTTIKSWFGA